MSATIVSRSPQEPGDVVAEAAATPVAEVTARFERARRAGGGWAALGADVRAGALSAAGAALAADAEAVARLIVREVGKPIAEARGEVARGVAILRYQAQAALDADGDTYAPLSSGALLLARRRPRGVAGLVTPWNFPLAIPLWKAAPALAHGNAVVLKPSPHAVAVALRVGELLAAALPEDLVQVVTGGPEVGRAVVAHADVVSFTGSDAAGAQIVGGAAERGIPVQAEMGGCNASIVLPDADLAAVATTVAASAMGFAGQKCTATSRIVAVDCAGPLLEALDAAIAALPLGDPADPATVVGPLIDAAARERVVDAVSEARSSGATVLASGAELPAEGSWAAPTLAIGVEASARVACEEIFGPFAVVLEAPDAAAAVELANASRHGLVTSVFTRDLDRALSAVRGLRSGLVRVNQPTSGVDFHMPFGGEAASSYGPREQGRQARELFTSMHSIAIAAEREDAA